MKILMAVVTGIIFMMNFTVVSAANIMDYPRVAVMQFGNKAITSEGMKEIEFDSASEYAIYQLFASGWFDLIDYEQLNAIAKMHNINNSGMVDPATVVQMGKFAGAQFMVVGNVTGLNTKQSGLNYQHGNAANLGVKNNTVIANVAMRIVDIETGRIAVAGLGTGESSSANVEIAFKKYRNNSAQITNNENEENTGNPEVENEGNPDTEDPEAEGGFDESANEYEEYKIKIGAEEFSNVQVRNAISKAVRDAIYGKMGLLTTLNGGKPLKIKTGF